MPEDIDYQEKFVELYEWLAEYSDNNASIGLTAIRAKLEEHEDAYDKA
jgi:glycine cleavage system H lipoate-binding protein